jgi:hypothetical protein
MACNRDIFTFLRASDMHLFLKTAGKVYEVANFVFVQLIQQEPGLYHKRHPDCARRDKIDLASERVSNEMKESGKCVYVLTDTYNRIQMQNVSYGRGHTKETGNATAISEQKNLGFQAGNCFPD